MRIYSLLDLKVREYGALVLGSTDEAIKRAVRDGIPGSNSTISKYPGDFNLMYLGEFDDETGVIVPVAVPLLVENVGVLIPSKED